MRGALVVIAIAACHSSSAPEQPPPFPEVVGMTVCADVQVRDLGRLSELARGFGRARLADDYPPVREALARPGNQLAFETTCPAGYLLGNGAIVDVSVGDDLRIASAFVSADGEGVVVDAAPPRAAYAGMAVTRAGGALWVSARRRWMVADLELEVTTDSDRVVLDGLDVEVRGGRWRRPQAGYRITAIDVDGVARSSGDYFSDTLLSNTGSLVVAGLHRGRSRVRIRLEGWPTVKDPTSSQSSTLLGGWMPYVRYHPTYPLDLHAHYRGDETITIAGVSGLRGDGDGWQSIAIARTGGEYLLALIEPHPAPDRATTLAIGATHVTFLERIDATRCQAALTRAVNALAPLGPMEDLALHTFLLAHNGGYLSHGLVLVDGIVFQELCQKTAPLDPHENVYALTVLTHELAHTYFGDVVGAGGDEVTDWWEALAEYASVWALEPADAAGVRGRWAESYAAVSKDDVFPMAQRYPMPRTYSDHYSYPKGALLVTALEDRIGRDKLIASLRRLLANDAGKAGSWADVVAAVRTEAGAEPAAWLDTWLHTPGAPALRIAEVAVSGGRVRAVLTQGTPAFPGTVTLGFASGEAVVARTQLPLTGTRTAIDLAIPAGADALVLDPDHRLPIAYDPHADTGRRATLSASSEPVDRGARARRP